MVKLSTAGLVSLFGGLVVFMFHVISFFMEREDRETLSLDRLLDEKYLGWMDGVSWFGLEKIAVYLVTMPLFMLLIGLGVLLLIAGFFIAK